MMPASHSGSKIFEFISGLAGRVRKSYSYNGTELFCQNVSRKKEFMTLSLGWELRHTGYVSDMDVHLRIFQLLPGIIVWEPSGESLYGAELWGGGDKETNKQTKSNNQKTESRQTNKILRGYGWRIGRNRIYLLWKKYCGWMGPTWSSSKESMVLHYEKEWALTITSGSHRTKSYYKSPGKT